MLKIMGLQLIANSVTQKAVKFIISSLPILEYETQDHQEDVLDFEPAGSWPKIQKTFNGKRARWKILMRFSRDR